MEMPSFATSRRSCGFPFEADISVGSMPSRHGPANQTPVRDRRFSSGRTSMWEFRVSAKQQHVNQVRNQPRVPVVIRLLVLPTVSIHVRLNHPPGVPVCGETYDVNAEPGPTPMEEQRVIVPVDEPLVFHDLGYHSVADMIHFLPRELSVECDGRSARRQILGLPCARDRYSHVRPLFAPSHPVSILPVPRRPSPKVQTTDPLGVRVF